MKKDIDERLWISIILMLDGFLLLFSLSELSISYNEAHIFFDADSFLHYMMRFFCTLFGQNDFALRLPFVVLHFANVFLIYSIGKNVLKHPIDRVMSVLMYVMLPGVNASALIINEASLVIFMTLLFVYLWQSSRFLLSYVVLILCIFIDNAFSIFYLSLFFYGLAKKERVLFSLSFVLFSASMYIYGFDAHGIPKGHFLDTLGIYAATLSPIVLIYYIYTLYRVFVKEEKTLLWFICFGAFVFSLLFSLRQRLFLEDFLPFAVIGVPLMVKTFLNSYRVRLSVHRRSHRVLLSVVLISLGLNFIAIHANKMLYFFYDKPKRHFAYKHQIAKELAFWLSERKIKAVYLKDKQLAKRLRFYGIEQGGKVCLKKIGLKREDEDIFKIDFFSRPLARYEVVNVP